jgi:hypothetical protein
MIYIVLITEQNDDSAHFAKQKSGQTGKVVAVRTNRQEAITIACALSQWATIEEWEPNAEKGKIVWNSLYGFLEFA